MNITRMKSEHRALLGKISDRALSEISGFSSSAVLRLRNRLGIDPVTFTTRHKWSAEHIKLLGTMPDFKVALIVGVTEDIARHRRLALGVESFCCLDKVELIGGCSGLILMR